MTQGLDVSSHQGDPATWDPAAIKKAGYDFVIVKATEGAGYRNPSFPLAVKRLREAGIVVGAYHWISANSTPADQIANAVKYIGNQIGPGDLPVALDFEEAGATHAQLDECRRLLRAAGHRTMTYTYPDFWTRIGNHTCTECAGDRLWWASYNPTMLPAPAPFKSVSMWQFAGTAITVPGLPGKQDANRLLSGVTLASLLTPLAPAPAPPQVDTPPAPTPVEEYEMITVHVEGWDALCILVNGTLMWIPNTKSNNLKTAGVFYYTEAQARSLPWFGPKPDAKYTNKVSV